MYKSSQIRRLTKQVPKRVIFRITWSWILGISLSALEFPLSLLLFVILLWNPPATYHSPTMGVNVRNVFFKKLIKDPCQLETLLPARWGFARASAGKVIGKVISVISGFCACIFLVYTIATGWLSRIRNPQAIKLTSAATNNGNSQVQHRSKVQDATSRFS